MFAEPAVTCGWRWTQTDHFFFSDDNSSRLLHKRRHEQFVCRARSCVALIPTEVFLRALACGFTLQKQRTPKKIWESSLPGAHDRKLLVSCVPSVSLISLRLRLVDRRVDHLLHFRCWSNTHDSHIWYNHQVTRPVWLILSYRFT